MTGGQARLMQTALKPDAAVQPCGSVVIASDDAVGGAAVHEPRTPPRGLVVRASLSGYNGPEYEVTSTL